jgi:VCBS repeat-containing protein
MNNFTLNGVKRFSLLALIFCLSACFDGDGDDKEPNVAPVASDIDLITQTETEIQDNIPAIDANGDPLSYQVDTQATLGIVSIASDGSFVYTPNAEATGTDSFTYLVSDGIAPAVSGTVNITIEALQVSFSDFSRNAFNQNATDTPLSVNGREFTQDVANQSEYQDLIDGN